MRTLAKFIGAKAIELIDQHQPTLQKAAVGIGSVTGGVTVSLATVKEGLQVASLLIGCAVGIATFISILRKKD